MTTANDLTKLRVADLKALLKEKGLRVSGTKAELIARLQFQDLLIATSTKRKDAPDVSDEDTGTAKKVKIVASQPDLPQPGPSSVLSSLAATITPASKTIKGKGKAIQQLKSKTAVEDVPMKDTVEESSPRIVASTPSIPQEALIPTPIVPIRQPRRKLTPHIGDSPSSMVDLSPGTGVVRHHLPGEPGEATAFVSCWWVDAFLADARRYIRKAQPNLRVPVFAFPKKYMQLAESHRIILTIYRFHVYRMIHILTTHDIEIADLTHAFENVDDVQFQDADIALLRLTNDLVVYVLCATGACLGVQQPNTSPDHHDLPVQPGILRVNELAPSPEWKRIINSKDPVNPLIGCVRVATQGNAPSSSSWTNGIRKELVVSPKEDYAIGQAIAESYVLAHVTPQNQVAITPLIIEGSSVQPVTVSRIVDSTRPLLSLSLMHCVRSITLEGFSQALCQVDVGVSSKYVVRLTGQTVGNTSSGVHKVLRDLLYCDSQGRSISDD